MCKLTLCGPKTWVFLLLTEHHLPLQGFFASCSVMIGEVREQSAFYHFFHVLCM